MLNLNSKILALDVNFRRNVEHFLRDDYQLSIVVQLPCLPLLPAQLPLGQASLGKTRLTLLDERLYPKRKTNAKARANFLGTNCFKIIMLVYVQGNDNKCYLFQKIVMTNINSIYEKKMIIMINNI